MIGAPLRLDDVSRVYGSGESAVRALDRVTAAFQSGTFAAIMGPSGSGKSTLLHCAAGLDRPDGGTVTLLGESLDGRTEDELAVLRRNRVAFVFQSYNLMPVLTVAQNVALPAVLAGRRPDRARIHEVLGRLGLSERAHHRPGQLSGGQQQRVAIARALVGDARVLFADEPTGALDTSTAHEVLGLLRAAADEYGTTVLMVTHDPVAASYAHTALFLVDGRIVEQVQRPGADRVAALLAGLSTRTRVASGVN
ncbi:putative ABC transport system ATP-binding protein [Diaminobutyricimonas aerilata]|uniref:Putative ABC transport system ATP-binding protein n=1 Tax=Diaminobutyricimonas aerilata TaxID=1162967 RepID=A0A2M9CFB5_9MICO|nr:ABC transporter ATP-binding protein [Diaminobutyricimonas aerilata]PJJ70636.1 putative ABC transport system ATP-binding protein [Diaminobutyricimonas aerilata]